MTIATQTLIFIIGLCLLGFCVFKKDAVICAMLGFTSAIVFIIPVTQNLVINELNLVYLCLVFISAGITVYKIFVGVTETDEIKSPFV